MVSNTDEIVLNNLVFVFSDGHGIAAFTNWFDDLNDLNNIDWSVVCAVYWADTLDDSDRQRRKQAEFLVYEFCPFHVVKEVGVIDQNMKILVEKELRHYHMDSIPVNVHRDWYY